MPQTDTQKDSLVWSNPSTYGTGTGVHHGYSTAKATEPDWLEGGAAPASVWYAKLEPGGFIVPHVDQGPWRERWHYPISGMGYVRQEWVDVVGPSIRLCGHVPYRMNHHRPHAVWNPWTNLPEPRVILIVEYDNPIDQPTTDLIICDMIPEIQTMIDAI